MSVQFEPLTALRTPQLGLLWKEFRDQFPKIEEHAPLEPMMERFGVTGAPKASVRFEMINKPPLPRCWFLNDEGTELLQIQHDRLAHNWRKTEEQVEYRRYDNIRTAFLKDFNLFREFVSSENLGEVHPNQCELTYVNHIESGEGWEKHGELASILTLFETKYTDEFLPELEEVRVGGAYVIPGSDGKPLGRLRFSIDSAYRRKDNKPIMALNLVARGRPDGAGIDGVMKFLDTGHEWIVRGFAAMTTNRMHKIWGRSQ